LEIYVVLLRPLAREIRPRVVAFLQELVAPVVELRALGHGGRREGQRRRGAGADSERGGLFQELSTAVPLRGASHRLPPVTRKRDAHHSGSSTGRSSKDLRCGRLCSARWARSRPGTHRDRARKFPATHAANARSMTRAWVA